MTAVELKILEVILMIIIALTPTMLRRIGIPFPRPLGTALVMFCFCALMLGDVADFYGRFEWWDTLLHGLSGILLGVAAYTIIAAVWTKVTPDNSFRPAPIFTAAWIICFVLAVGSLWEMMEYVTDGLLGLNSQQFLESGGTFDETVPLQGREALSDTMEDMLMNLAGAGLTAIAIMLLQFPSFRRKSCQQSQQLPHHLTHSLQDHIHQEQDR
jgi:uncharacterized membrane protein YjdF